MSRGKKCVRRGCPADAEKCGACRKHYIQAYRRLKAKKATREELIEMKWLAAPQPKEDDFDKAIKKLRAKKKSA